MKTLILEYIDRPEMVNRVVTRVTDAGFNIRDICYTIYDTDLGKSLCIAQLDDTDVPNAETVLQEARASLVQDCGRIHAYERWFRRPTVRLTVVSGDRIGLVRDVVASTVQALDRNRNGCKGNILDLKGFSITDEGLYAIQLLVATTTLYQQARLVALFEQFCETNEVLSYDVVFDNFLTTYCDEAQSDAS